MSGSIEFPARGCFFRVSTGNSSTRYYKLSPDIAKNSGSPILLQSASRVLSDLVAPVPCLDNIKRFYTFGQSFGNVRIGGSVLLGPAGNVGDGEKVLEDYFQSNRTSNNGGKLLQLSSGSAATPFFLNDLKIGELDVDLHVLPFSLDGVVVESKKS